MRPGSASAPSPRVFVIGATGYVGSELVRLAAAHELVEAVSAHVRPGSPRADAALERFSGMERVTVSRAELETSALASALAAFRPTHVFLCHGTTRAQAKREDLEAPYEAVDVGVTALATAAAADLDPAPRIVHLSSVGADPRARSAYLAARGRAEGVVRSSGLPYTICRAPLLSGPDRAESRPLETLARRVTAPLLRGLGAVGFGKLRDRYAPMDATEAAEGLLRSAFHYMTIGRVVESDELRRVGVYERERWTPASRRDTARF